MTEHDHEPGIEDALDGLLGFLRGAAVEQRLNTFLEQVKLHVAIDGYFAHDPRKVQQ